MGTSDYQGTVTKVKKQIAGLQDKLVFYETRVEKARVDNLKRIRDRRYNEKVRGKNERLND